MGTIFSLKGRLGRLAYLGHYLVSMLIFMLAMLGAGFLAAIISSPSLGTVLLVLFTLVVLIYTIVISARRLHDLNLSGWLYLLVFVPLLGIVFWFYMLCKGGDTTSNKYGEPPIIKNWERIFGWLNLVLIPVVIFAVIQYGLPAYAEIMQKIAQAQSGY